MTPSPSSRRSRWAVTLLLASILCDIVVPALAQQSAGYDLREHNLNAGGHPAGGAIPSSADDRITLDAIGGPVAMAISSSAGFQLSAGFVSGYPPPGEVKNLRFGADAVSLGWDVEPGAGTYQVYRDLLDSVAGGGVCAQPGLILPQASDAQSPPTGRGYFYLVTSRNLLGEEGTKGFASNGVERLNTLPCP